MIINLKDEQMMNDFCETLEEIGLSTDFYKTLNLNHPADINERKEIINDVKNFGERYKALFYNT